MNYLLIKINDGAVDRGTTRFRCENYVNPPQSIDDLKMKIIQEMDNLKQDQMLIKRAVRDTIRRANMCIDIGRRHHIESHLEN